MDRRGSPPRARGCCRQQGRADGTGGGGRAEEEEEDEEEEEMEEEDFSLLRVAELKQRLSALGLPTDGKKAVLVERMQTRPLTASRKGNKA